MNRIWTPQPKQRIFQRRGEYEGLYGGAAGGGKSEALVIEALRQVHIPYYKGLILRKTYPELSELIEKSLKYYPRAFPGARYNEGKHTWVFPSGAKIVFGSMQHTKDRTKYQGRAFDFIAFDELTHFTWDEYSYLFSRNRPNGPGTRVYIRSTANPGGVGHGWVKERFITAGPPETTLWENVEIHFPDGHREKRWRSRVCVRASVFDNPRLLENDPHYMHKIALMSPAEKEALLYGNWDSFTGQVFTEWRNDPGHYGDRVNTHVIDPFRVPDSWRIWCGLDWGYSRPFSVAWLFNAILNKHADAMDNYPEPIVLPREPSDEESAKVLSSVLPVVLEYNDYEQTYSDNWWEKLKHGTAAYGVFWNPRKENGLGDIDVTAIDLLKLFWEPGITDLQQSRNLFLVELVDEEVLEEQYPQHKGNLGSKSIDVKQYIYDETIDLSGKSVVVDWYYKKTDPTGRTILHYAKFVGETLLFASENEPEYQERGWYDHGQYPVVLDTLFPEKGTPVGFGYVAICKDPQLYIDKLSANIMENAMMSTKKRFFVSESTAINEEEFLDWNRPLVHVAGELDERRLQEIVTQPLSGIYLNIMQMKIEEMKDTAANRDVNSGGSAKGVTAAAAIAALQEAGSKTSRDMIAASYRAYIRVASLCIELMRQFYSEKRSFRIAGGADPSFVEFSNRMLVPQIVSAFWEEETLYRLPVFDLKIKAQKKNPFSRMEQNERAKELYALGFFNPERAQEALAALEMMEFEGKEQMVEQVRSGQTLLRQCEEMSRQITELVEIADNLSQHYGAQRSASTKSAPEKSEGLGSTLGQAVTRAVAPSKDYIARLVKRSTPGKG